MQEVLSFIWGKIQSRKFQVAVGVLLATWLNPEMQAQAQGFISAVVAAGYAIGEGLADSRKA
jgi:hypothetical protein